MSHDIKNNTSANFILFWRYLPKVLYTRAPIKCISDFRSHTIHVIVSSINDRIVLKIQRFYWPNSEIFILFFSIRLKCTHMLIGKWYAKFHNFNDFHWNSYFKHANNNNKNIKNTNYIILHFFFFYHQVQQLIVNQWRRNQFQVIYCRIIKFYSKSYLQTRKIFSFSKVFPRIFYIIKKITRGIQSTNYQLLTPFTENMYCSRKTWTCVSAPTKLTLT